MTHNEQLLDALKVVMEQKLIVHVWQEGDFVSVAKSLRGGSQPPDSSDAWVGYMPATNDQWGREEGFIRAVQRWKTDDWRHNA